MADEITPYKVYTARQVAELVGVDKRTIYKLIDRNELKARNVGRGFKILGENVLSYLGSATYPPTSAENQSSQGIPTSEQITSLESDR